MARDKKEEKSLRVFRFIKFTFLPSTPSTMPSATICVKFRNLADGQRQCFTKKNALVYFARIYASK